MSRRVARMISLFAAALTSVQPARRRFLTQAIASDMLVPVIEMQTPRGPTRMLATTGRATHDIVGFGRDEPETVRWIDELVREGDVMWDIGANVGVYTIYGAAKGARVLAFEPSAATFSVLMRNVELNGFGDRVAAFCIALSDRTGIDYLHMADSGAGHSMHAFGQFATFAGELKPSFSQATLAFTIDDLVKLDGVSPPDHIKLDVDSIEAKILRGAASTLPHVRSVLVEILGDRAAGDNPATVLAELGFVERDGWATGDGSRNRLFLNPAVA